MRRLAVAALACALFACVDEPRFPGNEVMGTFALHATPVADDCQRADELLDGSVPGVPDGGFVSIPTEGFEFGATFSRQKDNSQAWLTVGGVWGEAVFDGQVVTSTRSAYRSFPECRCGDGVQVVETMRVALVSRSQSGALDGGCPANPLDGGMPAPDEDAGIVTPQSTVQGFDAIRACGELEDRLVPDADAGCTCIPCTLTYKVEGDRK
ncbi:MAG: hypothetical protein ACYC8T_09035 [Myxococcaceae bacterium]